MFFFVCAGCLHSWATFLGLSQPMLEYMTMIVLCGQIPKVSKESIPQHFRVLQHLLTLLCWKIRKPFCLGQHLMFAILTSFKLQLSRPAYVLALVYSLGTLPSPASERSKSQIHPAPNVVLLWMDEILHHFESMRNHCLLVFTGKSTFQGFLGGVGFRLSTVCVGARSQGTADSGAKLQTAL